MLCFSWAQRTNEEVLKRIHKQKNYKSQLYTIHKYRPQYMRDEKHKVFLRHRRTTSEPKICGETPGGPKVRYDCTSADIVLAVVTKTVVAQNCQPLVWRRRTEKKRD